MLILIQDLRLGLRRLRRYPAVAAAAAFTLALGIGACTAIFSIADAAWLRPLPFAQAEQIVTLWETHPRQATGYRLASWSAAETWRRSLGELQDLAVSRPWRPVLAQDQELVSLEGATVSTGFFQLLGVTPALGRAFLSSDAKPGAPPVVVLSHRLWRIHLGGNPRIVGSQIRLDGAPEHLSATVVGVLPPGLVFDRPLVHATVDIFAPLPKQEASSQFGRRYFRVVGRLAESAQLETAKKRLSAIAKQLEETQPDTNQEWGAEIDRLRDQLAKPIRPALLALLTGVGLVFLVACCNVGILLMSQASQRRREVAVRLALGASVWRVKRQILTECLLLALAGGLVGLWIAHQSVAAVSAYLTSTLPNGLDVTIDHRAFLFAVGLALATVLLLAMAPALRIARRQLSMALAVRARSQRPAGNRARRTLVAVELGLSSILLVTASMLISSFQQLAATDPGFDSQGVTTLRIRAVGAEPSSESRLYRRLLAATTTLPGIRVAGMINQSPLAGAGMSSRAAASTRPDESLRVEFRGVTSHYFEAMGIPVNARQDLHLLDRQGPESVAVISEAAALRLWPEGEALGQSLLLDWGNGQSRQVIAVVGDVRHPAAPEEVLPTVYLPFEQAPHRQMTLVLRGETRGEVLDEVRQRARGLGSPLVVDQPTKISQSVAASIAEPRTRALVVAAFALTALLLAAGGTYSVVSLVVEQRRYDSSVRQALGADPRTLIRGVMAEMMRPASLGIAGGLLSSLLLARALSSLLYGTGAQDFRILITTAVIMAAVAAVTSYLPARRLSNTDPAAALRSE